jgi:hypothetical protein
VPQLRIATALRAEIAARNLIVEAYQPSSQFIGVRKLALVAEPQDPWIAALRHAGMPSWVDGAFVGRATAATLDEAIKAALGSGDLLSALSRLGAEIDRIVAVFRA